MSKKIEIRKIVKNIGWLFFDKVMRMGIGLIIGIWITRYLGPSQFGQLSYSLALIGLLTACSSLGMQTTVVRDLVWFNEKRGEILGTSLFLQIIAGVVCYLLLIVGMPWISADLQNEKIIIYILGLMLIFKVGEVINFYFESMILSKYVVWISTSVFLIFALFRYILIEKGFTITAFAWAATLEILVCTVFTFWFFHKLFRTKTKLSVSKVYARELWLSSWPMMLSSIAIIVYMRIDQIMLAHIKGASEVGLYSAALRLSEAWNFIPIIVTSSVFPRILKMKNQNKEKYRESVSYLFGLMILISITIALPVTLFSSSIVKFLFGLSYQRAGTVLAIHIWTSIFVFIGIVSSQWMVAENLQKVNFRRTLVGAILNILLNLILIPRYSIVGAASATLISQMYVGFLSDLFNLKTRPLFNEKIKALSILKSPKKLFNLFG